MAISECFAHINQDFFLHYDTQYEMLGKYHYRVVGDEMEPGGTGSTRALDTFAQEVTKALLPPTFIE